MGLLENLRQWTSERIDDMLDQDNTYHRSSGKTHKEYANDLKTLQDLETAAKIGTVALGAVIVICSSTVVSEALRMFRSLVL